jgi:hypothetical protein
MIPPVAHHRIPPEDVRPGPGRTPRLVALVLLVGLAACGAEEGSDPASGEPIGADAAPSSAPSPPGSDIWLGDLVLEGETATVADLRNVTRRAGYDNQPTFLPDGSGFLYTVVDSTGQADIWRYELSGSGRAVQVTATSPESEYSATPLPWGGGFSAVRVEADSTQRLWRFDMDGRRPGVLFTYVEPVGYHAWADEDWVALFVLGDPPTLRIAGGETRDVREVAQNIGRSIQTIPDAAAVSFVQVLPDAGAEADTAGEASPPLTRIMRWSFAEGVTPIVDTPAGGDFHAWTPSGLLLMGQGDEIVAWREGWDGWRTVVTVPGGGTVTRLAVAPGGNRIAVVVEVPEGEG